jgi:hypothetical protein
MLQGAKSRCSLVHNIVLTALYAPRALVPPSAILTELLDLPVDYVREHLFASMARRKSHQVTATSFHT